MLTLPLEPTDDRANPAFRDVASCKLWLEQLQLTNLQQAHSKLIDQINELNRYPMRGLDRFQILELLRETVGFVQTDYAKKLLAKQLPLNSGETAVFLSITHLWQTMVLGYQRGLQAYISGEKPLASHGAVLCQRCLFYSGLEIFEHLRTGYEFSPGLWHQLHQLYAYAEQKKLHQVEVSDPPNLQPITCEHSYIRILLACYANPAQMTRWQLQQTDTWLSTWCDEVTIAQSCHTSKNDSKPLAVDLSGTQGLQRLEGLKHSDSLRYLATVPLSKLLRVKIILLQQGQMPQQTGLGDQLDSQPCLDLLTFLLQCWCETQHKRSIQRRAATPNATLCFKFEHIYANLSGKPFKPRERTLDNLALKQIATLGYVLPAERSQVEKNFPLEKWRLEDENILGARLIRTDEKGERVSCKQLVALRHEKEHFFRMAATAWVNVTHKGQLQTGIKYLPGRAVPVHISSSGINPDRSEAPAFLLPALPDIMTPASLIIPRGWFHPKRVIEVYQPDGKTRVIQLGFSVECGLDYERVSFTADEKNVFLTKPRL